MLAAARKQAAWIRSAWRKPAIYSGRLLRCGRKQVPMAQLMISHSRPLCGKCHGERKLRTELPKRAVDIVTGGDYGNKVNYYSDNIQLQSVADGIWKLVDSCANAAEDVDPRASHLRQMIRVRSGGAF